MTGMEHGVMLHRRMTVRGSMRATPMKGGDLENLPLYFGTVL